MPFSREGRRWTLAFPRPDADRLEYLLELRDRGGDTELVPDPENPLRAPGPFGDKSVVEFPEYAPPEWVSDEEAPEGELRPVELRAGRSRLEALLWSAAETDPQEPLPLLVVHDGPEYAQYSSLLRLLDHLVSFGEVPLLRAALLPPRADRNDSYSASTRYARVLTGAFLPQLRGHAPTDRSPVGMGASLGALAMLHAHWLAGELGGLFLQSGSYFRQRFDRQESAFVRFGRISRFVGHVLAGRGLPAHVPVTITCGTAEENRANNVALARALERQEWDVRLVDSRDAHNWTAWRDVLHPHLAELLLRAWT